MPCYHPMRAYRSLSGRDKKSGKWPIVFSVAEGYIDMPVDVPCGQCIGCRLERSRQWAMRCVHEASLYDQNCFVTLTYSDECLESNCLNNSLNKRDFQLFMKRLRKKYGVNIRFFHCGEYGELTNRPHHHACLFNFDFPDKSVISTRNGNVLYISPTLQKLWPYGFSTIGAVTFESAAYVARYILKKVTGKDASEYYCGHEPEYVTMSRRPGIGRGWYDKYKDDLYPHDYTVIRDGVKCRPAKYYDSLFDIEDPTGLEKIKYERKLKGREHADNNTLSRLNVRETVQTLRAEKLIRPVD